MLDSWSYRAPRWLPGGHLQTIWPALAARHHDGVDPQWRRERWTAPDGDFVHADWQDAASAQAPVVPEFDTSGT